MMENTIGAFVGLEVLPNESEFKLFELIRRQHPNSHILCRQGSTCSPFHIVEYLLYQGIITKDDPQTYSDSQRHGIKGHTNVEWDEGKNSRVTDVLDDQEIGEEEYFMGSSNAKKGSSYLHPLNCTLAFSYESTPMLLYKFTVRNGFGHYEIFLLVWDDENLQKTKEGNLGRKLFDEVFRWERTLRKQVWIFDERWRKDEKMFSSIQSTCKDDIILPNHLLKSMIKDLETFFSSQELFLQARIPWKRGMLLMGPPGNGKTAAIRALLQDHLDKPILYVKSFQTGRTGTPEQGVRVVFEKARNCAPCIMVLEDMDALVNDGIRAFVLNEIDGIADNGGIVLIASTNHPEKLDDAFLRRPSRFDRKYTFECPSKQQRSLYLRHWFDVRLEKSLRLVEDNSLVEKLLDETEGWSFALLQELFVSFSMQCLGQRASGIQQSKEDLQNSIQAIVCDLNIEQTNSSTKSKTEI